MQLKIGTAYSFPVGSVTATTTKVPRFSAGKTILSYRVTMRVAGYLEGNGDDALTALQLQLEEALSTPNQDIILYTSTGAQSATRLRSRDSISGVIVESGPDFTGSYGTEYVNQRQFSFTASVEIAAQRNTQLTRFTETLAYGGGAPLKIWKNAINGPPQLQIIYPSTPYQVIQSGSAASFFKYPDIPPPVFSPLLLMQSPDTQLIGPTRLGNSLIEFGITWKYLFMNNLPFIGFPTAWPKGK